ncbi:MAG: N-6 DNA methylase [Bryobacteraceae bacterium]|nr:N-6 DNA methylase [Bryobacteraceae bacterium]
MSTVIERLKKRRREAQEANHYSTSSRWHEALSKAISAIELAESATEPSDKFIKCYLAADGLSQLHRERGESDFIAFQRWIGDIKTHPEVNQYFREARNLIPAERFRLAVHRSQSTLLEREGKPELTAWTASSSPEKACAYFFAVVRAKRNRVLHGDLNLSSPGVRKVLATGAECLLPVMIAAIDKCIDWPPEGTTGKAPPYRFFLYPFLKNSDSFFSDYYLERLFPEHELAAFPEDHSNQVFKDLAKQMDAKAPSLQTATAEQTYSEWLLPVLFDAFGLESVSGVRVVTDEAVFQPSGVLRKSNVPQLDPNTEFRGKHAGKSLSCLIWTLPWRGSLDSVATEAPFVSLPITEVAHRALAASDVSWALITNGRQLRLLSRVSSHKPRCFLDADLGLLVDSRGRPEARRAFRFLLGLFSGNCFTAQDEVGHTLLERVAQGSDRHGKEIGDELKANVFSALQELGEGFLEYLRANPQATAEWRDRRAPGVGKDKFLKSDVLLDEIYHESLSLMYRLLFLFYAESRELLPLENELYQTYSLESIRDDVHSVLDDPDPKRFFAKGNTTLWARLKELFGFLDKGWGTVIPPYNGGLFDPEKHEFLERFDVGDYYLAQAIDLLSRTKPRAGQNRGEGRKKVTYRDLDVRHLGSIYEGILEYTAHIADQDYVIVRDGSGGNATEEYVAVSELNRDQLRQFTAWEQARDENPDNPVVPRGCRVTGKVDAGQYYLAFGGRESKRKSSGSYYTPDYIVQFIVENTLGPLVRGECRPAPSPLTNELKSIGWEEEASKTGPLSSDEILDLKILDPSMGSGHFLVAATEYLARAYRDARLGEGSVPDEAKAEEEFVRYKRIIAERCIYGVDLNPMAVELAKLSMWLFTMDSGRPLSFLDHHFKVGNSLLGAQINDLGNVSESVASLSRHQSVGQANVFEPQFRARLPVMLGKVFEILSRETDAPRDILDKKTLDTAIGSLRQPFQYVADLWVGCFFGDDARSYLTLLSDVGRASGLISPTSERMKLFHWELEFPEVFFDRTGNWLNAAGFSAVIGNPPWGAAFSDAELSFLRGRNQPIIVRMIDSFMYFVYGSAIRTRYGGTIGMIVPDSLLYQKDCGRLRMFLSGENTLTLVVHVGEAFEGVVRPAAIFVSRMGTSGDQSARMKSITKTPVDAKPSALARTDDYVDVSRQALLARAESALTIESATTARIWKKICGSATRTLKDVVDSDGIQRGVSPDLKDAFLVDSTIVAKHRIERSVLKPVLTGGKHVKRFGIQQPDLFVIYTTRDTDFEKIPNACRYIDQFRNAITCREVKEGKHSLYALHRARDPRIFQKRPKFVGVITEDEIVVASDDAQRYATDGLYVFGINATIEPEYLMGLLNSRLFVYIYRRLSMEDGRALAQVKPTTLLELPLVVVSETAGWRKDAHDEIVKTVRSLKAMLESSSIGGLKASDQQKFDTLRSHVDAAVFRLYGLNSEDIQDIDAHENA